jgi:hypothetical protein
MRLLKGIVATGWLVSLGFGSVALAERPSGPPAPGRLSPAVIEQALAQPAPKWSYSFGKRTRDIDATFALFSLALAAHADRENVAEPGEPARQLVVRLREVLSGGREPECQGGLGGWTHGPFAWTVLLARKTPAVWNELSAPDRERADLVMQAMAVAACHTLDDDNMYRCLIDGDGNWAKGMNPNHIEGYVGVGLAAARYFGVDELDRFFETFDFDAFIARCEAAGLTNIVATWTHTPDTRRVLMEGGHFRANQPRLGLGRGVRGNAFTYGGHRLDRGWPIYRGLAERMFSKVTVSSLPIDGREETTRILDTDTDGNPLRSPWEGHIGMAYEFLTTNAHLEGTRFRSSLYYVYEGWMLNMANGAALLALGEWPDNRDTRTLRLCMTVGTEDFLFKARHGYRSFANGKFGDVRESNLIRLGGWLWACAWWTEVLAPAVAETP